MGNCISLNGRTEIAASASASASDSAPLQSLAPHSSSSDVEMEEDTPVFPPFEGLDMASDGSDYDPDDDASNGDTFSSMTIFQRSGSESPPAVQSGGRGGRRHRPVRQVRPAPFGKSRRCQAGISGLARGSDRRFVFGSTFEVINLPYSAEWGRFLMTHAFDAQWRQENRSSESKWRAPPIGKDGG